MSYRRVMSQSGDIKQRHVGQRTPNDVFENPRHFGVGQNLATQRQRI